jgi:hypothetical protein
MKYFRFGDQTALKPAMNKSGKITKKEKEDSLAPDDPRPDWAKEDDELEGKKPDLGEIEEDASEVD